MINSFKALLYVCNWPIAQLAAVPRADLYDSLVKLLDHDLHNVYRSALMVIGRLVTKANAHMSNLLQATKFSRG